MKINSGMIETITPKTAIELLEKNTQNRPISEERVAFYARQFRAGQWQFNGDSIKISKSGILLDGQHRLMACVRTGISFQCFIIEGIPDESFATIDTGMIRSAADVLMISTGGSKSKIIHQRKNIAATIRILNAYYNGEIGTDYTKKKNQLSNTDILNLYTTYDGVEISVKFCSVTKGLIPQSKLAALHYIFSRIDKSLADSFITDFVNGTNLNETDPVLIARNTAVLEMVSKIKNTSKYNLFWVIIKAWNIRRDGGQCKRISIGKNEKIIAK